ncbi:MAG: hypothetical protein GY820_03695 [Gammaproteobacteria bacterium]|nr:hypothetical protein [Gammaproteobacteria bacterium]
MSESYILKPGVILESDIEKKVKKIAAEYFKLSKKMIVVTSGTRSASSQASAMYGKLSGGDKLKVYRDQEMAKEILGDYNTAVGAKKTNAQILISLQNKIDEQIKNGKYISKHLKKGAVDIRGRDMTDKDKLNFKKSAAGIAKIVILETVPPHFHLQF